MHAPERNIVSPFDQENPNKPQRWQQELATAISDPAELLEVLELRNSDLPVSLEAGQGFAMRVPRKFVECMKKGDPRDPLLLQVLPIANELVSLEGFSQDPVGDRQAEAIPGLLHKYHGRALLLLTGACGIHCRYCFRRHFPYTQSNPSTDQWQLALEYLFSHPEIEEVILSGGDPLSLNDDKLTSLVTLLEKIPHLKRLRIHTRMAVVLPSRIGPDLLKWMENSRLQLILVTHVNHPNEISGALKHGLSQLRNTGAVLLNQSVLLRDINNDAGILAALSTTLFAAGVIPYYLHMLDRVRGAHHFEVSRKEAVAIMKELNSTLPGYLVPRLVEEIAGKPGKIPVS